ncbi:MAG: GNAT family N-acetyltransferase [Rhodobacteraceae bacterium]|nr:GNAT family N-acetyltransferase [Paracoccaceae bacterium]
MRTRTHRLTLRPLSLADTAEMAKINADPVVMAHFPAPMTHSRTAAFLERVETHWEANGFGLCALEIHETGAFIGFTGLTIPPYQTPASPCTEIGWRLAASAWGKGYAVEAAQACLEWGFEALGLLEIVSFTSTTNTRSSALMQRLGMRHDPSDDFDHPMLSPDSPLLRHVLYRMSAAQWRLT